MGNTLQRSFTRRNPWLVCLVMYEADPPGFPLFLLSYILIGYSWLPPSLLITTLFTLQDLDSSTRSVIFSLSDIFQALAMHQWVSWIASFNSSYYGNWAPLHLWSKSQRYKHALWTWHLLVLLLEAPTWREWNLQGGIRWTPYIVHTLLT